MTQTSDNNSNQATFQRPTHILLAEMRDLHQAMKDLCTQFNILAERMEQCASAINEVDNNASRKLFRDYRNAGVSIGRYIKFTDGQDSSALFHVVDIDSEGFWIRLAPDGQEYHLKLLPNRDRIPFIRSYPADSSYVRRCLRKDYSSANFDADMNAAMSIDTGPGARGASGDPEEMAAMLREITGIDGNSTRGDKRALPQKANE